MKNHEVGASHEAKPKFISKAVEKAYSENLIDRSMKMPDKGAKIPTVEQFEAWEKLRESLGDTMVIPSDKVEKWQTLKKGVGAGKLLYEVSGLMQADLFKQADDGAMEFIGAAGSEYHKDTYYDHNLPSRWARQMQPERHVWTSDNVVIRYNEGLIGISITTSEEEASRIDRERSATSSINEQVVIDLNKQEVYFTQNDERELGQTALAIERINLEQMVVNPVQPSTN